MFPGTLRGGFVGVDVFFAISGYVVTASLWRTDAAHLGTFLSKFYSRRLARIYPPLLVCLLVTFLLSVMFIPPAAIGPDPGRVGNAAVLGVSNVVLASLKGGYFSPGVELNPFTHTWSLGVEEQFYLIFPLLLFGARRQRKGPFWPAVSRVAFPAFVLLSLAYCALASRQAPGQAFYMLTSRFWELAVGAGLFLLQERTSITARWERHRVAVIALGTAVVLGCVLFASSGLFPFPWAVPVVLGSALTIFGISARPDATDAWSRFYASPAMTGLGRLSYSLYLWHWPTLVLMRWTCGLQGVALNGVAVAVMFALAGLSFRFVEGPTRHLGANRSVSRRTIIGASLAAIAVGYVGFRAIQRFGERLSLSVTKNAATWVARDAAIHETIGTGKPRLYVIGDSHAMAFYPMLRRFAQERHLAVRVDSFPGVPVLRLTTPMDEGNAEAKARLDALVAEAKRGDVAFVPDLRNEKLFDGMAKVDPAKIEAESRLPAAVLAREAALREADDYVGRLERKGVWVVFDAPKPVFFASPMRCADWFDRANPVCAPGLSVPKGVLMDCREPAMTSLATLLDRHTNFVVWDTYPTLCPGDTCSAFDGSSPLFFDADHLSVYGNAVLYPEFRGLVDDLLSRAPGDGAARADSARFRFGRSAAGR